MKTILSIIFASTLFITTPAFAAIGAGQPCNLDLPNGGCDQSQHLTCQRSTTNGGATSNDQYGCFSTPSNPTATDVFGKIVPPSSIVKFGFGAKGIGAFVSNLIVLIYSIAGLIFLLMLMWGAFDWITSEGEKEKVEKARNKIINAIIGMLLFAAAFGIISLVGQFTGFKFFEGQGSKADQTQAP